MVDDRDSHVERETITFPSDRVEDYVYCKAQNEMFSQDLVENRL